MALDLFKHEVYGTLTFDQVDDNWDDIQTLVNQINSRLPQNNWQATTNPTTSNDQTQGFVAGSRWYNTSTGDLFICTSAATGAAVWVAETTLTFADVTLDAVTTSGNSTTNAVDVGALRSTNWVGTVANGALGHVVERGSNANGEYVKFADGTMICQRQIALDMTVSGPIAFAYPSTWNSPNPNFRPSSFCSGVATVPDEENMSSVSLSSSNTEWRVFPNAVGTNTALQARLTAIGRWF